MRWTRLSLRWKITITNILLLSFACLFLVIGSNTSTSNLIDSYPMQQIVPSKDIPNTIEATEIEKESIIKDATTIVKATHKSTMSFYLLIVVLLGGIASYFFTKHTLMPLEMLEQKMEDFSADRLAEKITIPNSNAEIESLVSSFNQMTEQLEHNFILQKHYSQNVAHELRTPLAVMKAKIEVFEKKQDRSTQEYQTLVTVLNEYTNRLSEIVENILSYSNLDDVELRDQINLNEIVENIIKEKEEQHKETTMSFDFPSLITFTGNKVLLYRVLENLIENACRYSDKSPQIDIAAQFKNNKIIIEVKDNGIGISNDDKMKIFQPFYRIDKSRSRAYGGAGLGLYFSKQVIEKHSGTILVSDNHPKGTVFILTLPA